MLHVTLNTNKRKLKSHLKWCILVKVSSDITTTDEVAAHQLGLILLHTRCTAPGVKSRMCPLNLSPFTTRWGYGGHIHILNPGVLTGDHKPNKVVSVFL